MNLQLVIGMEVVLNFVLAVTTLEVLVEFEPDTEDEFVAARE